MWLKTSWTFKGRYFCHHLQKQENQRQIKNKKTKPWRKKCWLFFFSPEKEHPLRTTLMTSSKQHRGQRAVSHLVLYTNLKKDKATETWRGEEAAVKELEKETRMWILKKRCKWWFWVLIGQPIWAAVKSIPEWGGGAGDSGLWSEPTGSLKIHSAGACLCEVVYLSPAPAGPLLSQSAGSLTLSPPASTSVNLRQEFSPHFPDWHLYEVG